MESQSSETINKNDSQSLALTNLMSFYERVQNTSFQELKYISVNELYSVIQYDQAVLFKHTELAVSVDTLSNVAEADKNSEHAEFLVKLQNFIITKDNELKNVSFEAIDDDELKLDFKQRVPDNAILISILNSNNKIIFSLLLLRNIGFKENDIEKIKKIKSLFSHEFSLRQKEKFSLKKYLNILSRPKLKYSLLALLAIFFLFPFRSSVMAPAEIIADNPDLIRAPIEGIIEKIMVQPNQYVEEGTLLIKFNQDELIAQEEISENTVKSIEQELRQVSQQALNDTKSRVRLSILRGKMEKEKTNLAYYKSLLERSELKAPSSGTVVFEDTYNWLGRPVSIGEKIMLLSNKRNTKVEIQLPVNDAIDLEIGSDVLFFSNARPDIPLKGILNFHSYKAMENSNGDVAFRLVAEWKNDKREDYKNLGLRGSAKIYGDRRPLIWIVLRKPLAAVRKIIGV